MPWNANLKFSAVLGQTSAKSSMRMRPLATPAMAMSKKTTGLPRDIASDKTGSIAISAANTSSLSSKPFGRKYVRVL